MRTTQSGGESADEILVLAPDLAERIKQRSKKRLISIRLPQWQIEGAKRVARRMSKPYQALMQAWIGAGLRGELSGPGPGAVWVKKFGSFEEADRADEEYYASMSPEERLAIIQSLRESHHKLRGSPNDGKGLRRVARVVQ